MIGKDGRAMWNMFYAPFGETLMREYTFPAHYYMENICIHMFSGKEKDEETGYHYFGARYYDSDLSIWLSVDPLASKYPSLSPYTYCANNPVRLVDPDGMSFEGWEINYKEKTVNQVSSAGGNATQHVNAGGVTKSINMSTDDFVKKFESRGYTVNSNSSSNTEVSTNQYSRLPEVSPSVSVGIPLLEYASETQGLNTASKFFKGAGYALDIYSVYKTTTSYNNGEITGFMAGYELGQVAVPYAVGAVAGGPAAVLSVPAVITFDYTLKNTVKASQKADNFFKNMPARMYRGGFGY